MSATRAAARRNRRRTMARIIDQGAWREVMSRVPAIICLLLLCGTACGAALPRTPDQVEAYLAERERREPGITPGTERAVAWAVGVPARTPLALVYLHGYSATRQEVFPLAERVAASLGAKTVSGGRGRGVGGEGSLHCD